MDKNFFTYGVGNRTISNGGFKINVLHITHVEYCSLPVKIDK